MAVKRQSLKTAGIRHGNPVPAGVKIGNLVFSSMVLGRDAAQNRVPEDPEEEAVLLFRNMQDLIESAGGTMDNLASVTIYLKEGDDRDTIVKALNNAWVKTFPDEDTRPARGLFDRVQSSHFSAQIIAVLDQ
jgi:2-iminobutanoate/2-iminopropanoate deaminase